MSLEQKVKDIIVDQLGVDAAQVTPEASFIDDLSADSLDQVELIMAFKEPPRKRGGFFFCPCRGRPGRGRVRPGGCGGRLSAKGGIGPGAQARARIAAQAPTHSASSSGSHGSRNSARSGWAARRSA